MVLLALVGHDKEASFRRLINTDSLQNDKASRSFWQIIASYVNQEK